MKQFLKQPIIELSEKEIKEQQDLIKKFYDTDIIVKKVSIEQEETKDGTLTKRKTEKVNITRKVNECAKTIKELNAYEKAQELEEYLNQGEFEE